MKRMPEMETVVSKAKIKTGERERNISLFCNLFAPPSPFSSMQFIISCFQSVINLW